MKRRLHPEDIAAAIMMDDDDGDEASEDEADITENRDSDIDDIVSVEDLSEVDVDDGTDSSDETDDDSANKVFGRNGYQWRTNRPHVASNRQRNIVQIPHGLTPRVEACKDIADFFFYFMTPFISQKIVLYTTKRLPPGEPDLTEEEIYAYFGLLILFGVTKKHDVSIPEIWSQTSCHFLPIAALTMSRNRFQAICHNLCLDDIDTRHERNNGSDKFYKARELFEVVRERLVVAMEPSEQLCIDETLYSSRGKCRFRQFMPNKPAKYGLKYWNICDVKTGYVLDTNIYLGKAGDQRARNVGESVVMKLVRPFIKTGRGITCDNYFTSISLADQLWNEGLTIVGTLHKNKTEIPRQFLPHRDRPEYSSKFVFDGPKTMVSYVPKKNKAVILQSTQHHSDTVADTETRKPEIITCYNSSKGTVDSFDQKIGKYTVCRKTQKWTVNVLYYLLDLIVTNSVILLKIKNPSEMQVHVNDKLFRRKTIEDLGHKLLAPCLNARMESWKSNNFNGISRQLKDIAIHRGLVQLQPECLVDHQSARGRCGACMHRRRTNQTCDMCGAYVCKDHSSTRCSDCV